MLHRHRNDQGSIAGTPASWSPVQPLGTLIGVAGIVIGSYALVRAGLNTSDLSQPNRTVLGVEHTPLLALCEVGFGVVAILAAMTTTFGRVILGALLATMTAFGAALISAEPSSRLHHWFGVRHDDGWWLVGIGGLALILTLYASSTQRRPARPRAPQPLASDGHTVRGSLHTSLDATALDPSRALGIPATIATPPPDAAAAVGFEHKHFCLSACGSTFDMSDATEGDIRFCGLGHAQRWNGNTWELIPPDTDHEGLHTRIGASHT